MSKQTKEHRGIYFKDIETYIEWRLNQEQFDIEIEEIMNNPSYLSKFEEAMRAENKRRSKNYENNIDRASSEERSRGGKTSGDNNVKSGFWASLKTTEHQSYAGKKGGDKNVESGHWDNVIEAGKQWRIDNPELAHQIASTNGKRMNESLSPEFRKQHNTKVANKIYVMSNGVALKNPYVKSKYEKENPGVSVIASYVQNDDEYNYYHNLIVERKEQERLEKLKSKCCQHCGTECKPRSLTIHEKSCKLKKIIIDQLPNDVEFTSKIVKAICNKEGYSKWTRLLKDEKFIIKTYHGTNQHDPSMYKKK